MRLCIDLSDNYIFRCCHIYFALMSVEFLSCCSGSWFLLVAMRSIPPIPLHSLILVHIHKLRCSKLIAFFSLALCWGLGDCLLIAWDMSTRLSISIGYPISYIVVLCYALCFITEGNWILTIRTHTFIKTMLINNTNVRKVFVFTQL